MKMIREETDDGSIKYTSSLKDDDVIKVAGQKITYAELKKAEKQLGEV